VQLAIAMANAIIDVLGPGTTVTQPKWTTCAQLQPVERLPNQRLQQSPVLLNERGQLRHTPVW
jgi:hypothetical protein